MEINSAAPPSTHKRKRRESGESGGHERWLVSYADFITLLFAFFVVMYAIAMDDKTKAEKIAESIREALSAAGIDAPAGTEGKTKKQPAPSAFSKELSQIEELFKESFTAEPVPHFAPGDISVAQDHRGVTVRISATAFYKRGEVLVRPEGVPVLDRIALLLKKSTREIRVEGHTDVQPMASSEYATNWELSAARAAWVVRYLISKHGLEPQRLSAAGFAGYHPLAVTEDSAFKKNNRIEVVVLGPTQ